MSDELSYETEVERVTRLGKRLKKAAGEAWSKSTKQLTRDLDVYTRGKSALTDEELAKKRKK